MPDGCTGSMPPSKSFVSTGKFSKDYSGQQETIQSLSESIILFARIPSQALAEG